MRIFLVEFGLGTDFFRLEWGKGYGFADERGDPFLNSDKHKSGFDSDNLHHKREALLQIGDVHMVLFLHLPLGTLDPQTSHPEIVFWEAQEKYGEQMRIGCPNGDFLIRNSWMPHMFIIVHRRLCRRSSIFKGRWPSNRRYTNFYLSPMYPEDRTEPPCCSQGVEHPKLLPLQLQFPKVSGLFLAPPMFNM